MVPRAKLFYTLLKEYKIGGNFLKILQEIYTNNKIFIKTAEGLLQPITTSIGVKQGCVFSPVLFNIFINKICSIFDESCNPVKIKNLEVNCLLWADDLFLCSESATGLQNAINKMQSFYESLDLPINIKKTKIMIFNKRGLTLSDKFSFTLCGEKLEITNEYQYLGLKLRPSGSMQTAVQELHDKATRAWFGISHIIYKHKRMEVAKVFGLFDSLVTPVALYGSEFWLPLILPKKCLQNDKKLIEYWESLSCEKINQKCCRMTLSVHNKTSRLAVLGELGRFPLFIKSLSQCLNYKLSLYRNKKSRNLLTSVIDEMREMSAAGQDCWLTRVDKLETLLNIKGPRFYNKTSGKLISSKLQSKFSRFWIDKVNEVKGDDGPTPRNHNKLRTYSKLKASFTPEPYITQVRNRNQRAFLTRVRVSSHNLRIELGRRTQPITPLAQRYCIYCRGTGPGVGVSQPNQTMIDDEFHFLVQCSTFTVKRNCLYGKISSIEPSFMQLTDNEKFSKLLCPITPQAAKLVSKFCQIMFECRKKIDENI